MPIRIPARRLPPSLRNATEALDSDATLLRKTSISPSSRSPSTKTTAAAASRCLTSILAAPAVCTASSETTMARTWRTTKPPENLGQYHCPCENKAIPRPLAVDKRSSQRGRWWPCFFCLRDLPPHRPLLRAQRAHLAEHIGGDVER